MQVVKGYPDGKMSKHIVNLNVGDSLECKGPISKLPYKPNMKKKIGMVRSYSATASGDCGMRVCLTPQCTPHLDRICCISMVSNPDV